MSKLWNIKGIIISRREHQGLPCNSCVIKVCGTGWHVCWSERHIRAVPTNNDASSINISNDDTANSALFSSTGCKIRSSLRLSSEHTLSGGKDRELAQLSLPPVSALRLAPLPPRTASLAGLLEEGGLWTSPLLSTCLRI